MKINVNFTINVPDESMGALREMASADDNAMARLFVKCEAQDYLADYLADNGVRGVTVARSAEETF